MIITNREIARILGEIGEYLDMQGEAFKPRAYEKVAETVASMGEELGDMYRAGGIKALQEIPGIGLAISEKIEELIKTGRVKYYEQLKKKIPVDLANLTRIEGLGPKSIKKLYDKLKVKTIEDLERVAKAGKIAKLEGFGAKSEVNILKGIEFIRTSGGRVWLGHIMPEVVVIEERLRKLKEVERLDVCGSVRRRKETIGDVDILVASKKAQAVMDYFVKMPEVVHVYAHGETKASVKTRSGYDIDLRVVPLDSYGAALQYFTGSKDHNVETRKLAIKKGYTLNEYGLYRGTKADKGRLVAARDEVKIYQVLGLDYIEPELREMAGEIEAARTHALPKLIGYGDLKGDLQVQTNWTDGDASIEVMARAAMAAGLEYIAITDHTKRLTVANGLDEKRLAKQGAEIDALNKKFKGKLTILKGTECDILKDGSLDLSDAALSKLDVVGASVHSFFGLSRAEQTKRIIRAMENQHVDILFHPTGRILNKRDAYDVDIDAVIAAAKRTGTILEVNASERSDLKDEYIRKAIKAGVNLAIDSDAHHPNDFGWLAFGIAQARRGWAEKKDVINAWSAEKMLKMLK